MFEKAVFPFSRGTNRISQGVETRGSLISVPLALRVISGRPVFSPSALSMTCTFKHLQDGIKSCRSSLGAETESEGTVGSLGLTVATHFR